MSFPSKILQVLQIVHWVEWFRSSLVENSVSTEFVKPQIFNALEEFVGPSLKVSLLRFLVGSRNLFLFGSSGNLDIWPCLGTLNITLHSGRTPLSDSKKRNEGKETSQVFFGQWGLDLGPGEFISFSQKPLAKLPWCWVGQEGIQFLGLWCFIAPFS